ALRARAAPVCGDSRAAGNRDRGTGLVLRSKGTRGPGLPRVRAYGHPRAHRCLRVAAHDGRASGKRLAPRATPGVARAGGRGWHGAAATGRAGGGEAGTHDTRRSCQRDLSVRVTAGMPCYTYAAVDAVTGREQ